MPQRSFWLLLLCSSRMINAHVVDPCTPVVAGAIALSKFAPTGNSPPRDEVTEHMAGARKAMQQQQRLRVRRPDFATENIEAMRKLGACNVVQGDLSMQGCVIRG